MSFHPAYLYAQTRPVDTRPFRLVMRDGRDIPFSWAGCELTHAHHRSYATLTLELPVVDCTLAEMLLSG